MTAYIARRAISLVFVLLGMSVMTFTISRVIPSDPIATAFGHDVTATPEMVEALNRELGLDQPLPVQYGRYLLGVVQGDLGRSIRNNQPVLHEIKLYLPASIELAGAAILLYVPVGILLGIITARRAGGVTDVLVRLFAVLGVSVPVFWSALLLQLFFYRNLRWAPSGGRIGIDLPLPETVTGFYLIDTLMTGNTAGFVSSLHHLLLPALTLALTSLGLLTRMTRSSLLEVLHADYIRTARAKGLSEGVLLRRHALRNAMVPVVTIIGLQFAGLIAYVFLVEVVYSWPGIGSYAVRAIVGLDFAPIMGTTLIFSTIYVGLNFVVDMVYLALDPRIRY